MIKVANFIKLKLEIYRDNKKFYIEFNNGEAKSPLKAVGKSKRRNKCCRTCDMITDRDDKGVALFLDGPCENFGFGGA